MEQTTLGAGTSPTVTDLPSLDHPLEGRPRKARMLEARIDEHFHRGEG